MLKAEIQHTWHRGKTGGLGDITGPDSCCQLHVQCLLPIVVYLFCLYWSIYFMRKKHKTFQFMQKQTHFMTLADSLALRLHLSLISAPPWVHFRKKTLLWQWLCCSPTTDAPTSVHCGEKGGCFPFKHLEGGNTVIHSVVTQVKKIDWNLLLIRAGSHSHLPTGSVLASNLLLLNPLLYLNYFLIDRVM